MISTCQARLGFSNTPDHQLLGVELYAFPSLIQVASLANCPEGLCGHRPRVGFGIGLEFPQKTARVASRRSAHSLLGVAHTITCRD